MELKIEKNELQDNQFIKFSEILKWADGGFVEQMFEITCVNLIFDFNPTIMKGFS